MTNKSTLRKEALNKRLAMSDREFIAINEKLLTKFKTLNFAAINSIHIFLPITSKREPDTFLMIEWLQSNHPEIQIIVPKADFEKNLMSHYYYIEETDLLKNNYEIPEPQNAAIFIGIPDMVIVPLLAFDKKGFRVGYGKGFYDRYLENLQTQKIGLSFFDASEEIIDVHLNDIRLDKCITPSKIYKFI